jgi:hypothetical protein
MRPPHNLARDCYWLCLLGPLALGLCVGVQMMVAGLFVLGPASAGALSGELTPYGQKIVRPEHDFSIYVAGVLLTLFMTWVMVWLWQRKLASTKGSQAQEVATSTAWAQAGLAVVSTLVFVLLLPANLAPPSESATPAPDLPAHGLNWLILLAPGLIALVSAVCDLEYGFCQMVRAAMRAAQRSDRAGSSEPTRMGPGQQTQPNHQPPASRRRWLAAVEAALERRRAQIGKMGCYAVPALIILVLGVAPAMWSYLSGQFMTSDQCHHLNFFFMGPALSFSHGKAFETEFYSQYGIGWPLLASALSRLSALTYGRLAGMEIVYGCVYYIALFFLLRHGFRHVAWAALGALLALYWQLFNGLPPGGVSWQYPSSTMMRHPLDIAFFLALVLHQRSGSMRWTVAAGVAAALGVFFETETGVYLVVTYGLYWVLQLGLAPGESRPVGRRRGLRSLLVFGTAAAATLLPLLLYASRGTLFTLAFWRGWVEALVTYGSLGVGSLPVAEVPGDTVMCFMIMVSVYVGAIAWALFRGLQRSASRGDVLLAALGAYGLALLLLFVNRSHPSNLWHTAPPFAVLLAALMLQCHRALAGLRRHPSIPYALIGLLLVLLFAKESFGCYPNILTSLFEKRPSAGLSLRLNPRDLSGLPQDYEPFVRETRDICAAIRTLAPDGKGVAILDANDTLLYSTSDTCPWSRYASLFYMALTQQALDKMRRELVARAPKYIVTRGESADRPANWEFVWAPLYEIVLKSYVLRQTVGPYQIWQRQSQP